MLSLRRHIIYWRKSSNFVALDQETSLPLINLSFLMGFFCEKKTTKKTIFHKRFILYGINSSFPGEEMNGKEIYRHFIFVFPHKPPLLCLLVRRFCGCKLGLYKIFSLHMGVSRGKFRVLQKLLEQWALISEFLPLIDIFLVP